jgi:hypothetical protein
MRVQGVHVDQEAQLLGNRLLLAPGGKMSRQTPRPAGNGQAIVAENPQTPAQEVVH